MENCIKTDIVILNTKDVCQLYGFSRDEAYMLFNSKGCPLVKGSRRQHYKVVQSDFEIFLKSRKFEGRRGVN